MRIYRQARGLFLICMAIGGAASAIAQPFVCPATGNLGSGDPGYLSIEPASPGSDVPIAITVGRVAFTPIGITSAVEGNVISVTISGNIVLLTTPPPTRCLTASVGPLPPGTYIFNAYAAALNFPQSPPELLGTATVAVTFAPLPVTVVEYYNAEMDHYFMTSLTNEIALCDAGRPPCAGWVRTGESFKTWPPGTADKTDGNTTDTKICRLFNDSFAGKSAHFYATPDVCAQALSLFPDWQLETDELFDANFAVPVHNCSLYYSPVYRLYNNGMGGAPNHRFTKDYLVAQQMIVKGWTQEGVVFCVPNLL